MSESSCWILRSPDLVLIPVSDGDICPKTVVLMIQVRVGMIYLLASQIFCTVLGEKGQAFHVSLSVSLDTDTYIVGHMRYLSSYTLYYPI